MDKSAKPDPIDQQLNIAREELARLAATEEQQHQVLALKQTILDELPVQQGTLDGSSTVTGLHDWLFHRWWRPALAACLPALIGFAAGVWSPAGIWTPSATEDANLGLFADMLLAQDESFSWEVDADE